MQPADKNNARINGITALLLLLTVIIGRFISVFQSISATDIAYADWVSNLMSYLGEIVVCARIVVSFTAVAAAAYYRNRSALTQAVVLSAAAAVLDYAARFFIDYISGSLTDMVLLAVIWLLLQLLYELIFIALAVLIVLMMKRRFLAAESPYQAKKYTCIRALRYALILTLLSHVALETYYLVDFLLTYSNITNTEIASIIGQFLKIFVIYGGIALLIGEGLCSFYVSHLTGRSTENG